MNTLQAIYKRLRESEEPLSARELSNELGVRFKTVQSALQRLRHNLTITKVYPMGRTDDALVRWQINAQLAHFPERRGKSPGSREALRVFGGWHKPRTSRKSLANLKHVRIDAAGNYHPKPTAATTLEQCWGWSPSRTVDGMDTSCVNGGGTVRPENAEAA